jgi:hypothetical protein
MLNFSMRASFVRRLLIRSMGLSEPDPLPKFDGIEYLSRRNEDIWREQFRNLIPGSAAYNNKVSYCQERIRIARLKSEWRNDKVVKDAFYRRMWER